MDIKILEIPEVVWVPALVGEERWLAQIEGGAVDDLAGRTFTNIQLHDVVGGWMDRIHDSVLEDIGIEKYSLKSNPLPIELEVLIDLYTKMWDAKESTHTEIVEPYWPDQKMYISEPFRYMSATDFGL
jgi:hypothetical protein